MHVATSSEQTVERDAEALHEALEALARVYQFRDRDRICCHDVSVAQCYALQEVVREGPLTLGELATRLFLDKSTASRVVSALERKGYVKRSPHPEDARALRLEVTPAGKRIHGAIRASLVSEARAVLEGTSPAFRREAVRLLGRLTQAVAVRMGVAPPCCDSRGRE